MSRSALAILFVAALALAPALGAGAQDAAPPANPRTDAADPAPAKPGEKPNVATYDAKEILEKAFKSIDQSANLMGMIYAGIGLALTILATGIGYVWNASRRLNNEITTLQKQLTDLNEVVEPLRKASEQRAAYVTQISSRLGIGYIAFMDSDAEREMLSAWIKQTDDELGIVNLERMLEEVMHTEVLSPTVYQTFGHFYRFTASRSKCADHRQAAFAKSQSYYRLALIQENWEPRKKADVHGCIAVCQHSIGNLRGCLFEVRQAKSVLVANNLPIYSVLHELEGFVLMSLEDFSAAEREYAAALTTSLNRPRLAYNIACNHGLLADQLARGKNGEAGDARYQASLDWLREIDPQSRSLDMTMAARAWSDSDLRGLRDHPKFGDIFKEWAGAEPPRA